MQFVHAEHLVVSSGSHDLTDCFGNGTVRMGVGANLYKQKSKSFPSTTSFYSAAGRIYCYNRPGNQKSEQRQNILKQYFPKYIEIKCCFIINYRRVIPVNHR